MAGMCSLGESEKDEMQKHEKGANLASSVATVGIRKLVV